MAAPESPSNASPPPLDVARAAAAARISDPAAATQAYLDAVPAERRAKTMACALGNDSGWSRIRHAMEWKAVHAGESPPAQP